MESVRRMRREKGLSQQELAELAGVGQDSISAIETGKHEPHPRTLRKLATALDVEVADFFIVKGSAHMQGTGKLEAAGEIIKKIRQIADELAGGKRSPAELAEELEEQARKLRKPAA